MDIPPHDPAATQRFIELIGDPPGAVIRPMFGSVGAFTGGRMYAGVFGDRFGVKLDPAEQPELEALPGSAPFGPPQRPMSGWVSLPTDLSDADAAAWFERARGYVATLPPKEHKPRR